MVKKERVIRMIRNKKEIEEKLIERLTQKAKEYVKNMDEKSNGEYYPIDVIEKDLVDIQKVSQEIFKETTEELINAIDEDKEIEKKRETDEKLYILTDGATWIRNACKEIFPDAVQILDKFHLEENLYTFAKNKYGEDGCYFFYIITSRLI